MTCMTEPRPEIVKLAPNTTPKKRFYPIWNKYTYKYLYNLLCTFYCIQTRFIYNNMCYHSKGNSFQYI